MINKWYNQKGNEIGSEGDIMNNFVIRKAKSDDVDRIYAIERECFPEAEAASKKAIEERVTVFPDGFLVGELDNEIISFINGAATSSMHLKDEFFASMSYHEDSGATLMVFGLDVHPEFQRKGYAAELMNAFVDKAVLDNRKRIILTCKEHLIHYYAKFGFVNEGISESEHGGAKWYDMVKSL